MTAPRTHKVPEYLVPSPWIGKESTGNSQSGKERYSIPAGYSWDDGWELVAALHLEVNTSDEEVVAVTCLNLQEYGMGDSLESAIVDLLTSLSDYYQSLESREANLASSAVKDLDILRHLLRVSPDEASGD